MEQYRPRGFNFLPPVVKNLIIINIIIYFAAIVLEKVYGIKLAQWFGLHFFKGEDFHFYQYITYMFLHSPQNFGHVFFNMFALWMFGYTLENIWGSKRFLIFYFVTGIGAAVVQTIVQGIEYYHIQNAINQYAQNANVDSFIALVQDEMRNYNPVWLEQFTTAWRFSGDPVFVRESIDFAQKLLAGITNVPTVGASGAVYGILLAFGMMFPNTLIFIYFLVPIKAKWFVLIYGAIELFMGFTSTGDGIAHFAHLGGMIFGYFLIRHWQKNSFTRWD